MTPANRNTQKAITHKVIQSCTDVFWRTLAAIPVAYVATNLTAIALGLLLPIERADAAQIGLLSSFLIYAAIVVRIFSPVSLLRVWTELIIMMVVSGLVVAVNYYGGVFS